jgi:ankyrin repeat protein
VFGNLEILKLLSEHGGNLNQPVGDATGHFPVHIAAIYGYEDIVRWIYTKKVALISSGNKRGLMSLHLAAQHNYINVLSYLIDFVRLPVDTPTTDQNAHTALHIASCFGNYSAVNFLIDRKADVNKVSGQNLYRPLHYATIKNNPVCVQLLYRSGGNVHVHYGNEDSAGRGEPLLITAAKYNSYDVAEILLSENVNVSVGYRDTDGCTALHHAAINSGDKLTRLLLAKGAHVDDVNNSKRTALHYAVYRGDTQVLQEILRNSPSLSVQENYGMNPVHLAAYVGKLACLKLLIKDRRQFDIQTANPFLDLPIHLAALGGHTDVVKWMIECGVPIDVRNGLGRTALDNAIEGGHRELRDELLSKYGNLTPFA